jgi:signal transduction histidine kinase
VVGAVVAVSLAAVAFVTGRVTRREFDRFLTIEEMRPAPGLPDAVRAQLEAHARARGGWEGVAGLIPEMAPLLGDRRLLVLDANDRVALATEPDLAHATVRRDPDGWLVLRAEAGEGPGETAGGGGSTQELVLRGGGTTVTDASGRPLGVAYLLPAEPSEPSRDPARFLVTVDRAVIAAVCAAGLFALGFTALLARRMLRPIEKLRAAARELGSGDLSRRAAVHGEDEIADLARAFNGMADGLARIEKLRRDMIADVAHELRTPLTGLRCQIEALQDGLASPTREAIDSLHEDVLLLGRVIDDLQDLSLAAAGQLRVDPRPLDVREAIERAVRPFESAGGGPGIERSIPEALPRVVADPDRLAQILRNLLANAVRHTPPGGSIRVTALEAAGTVEIEVRDSGPGIAVEDLPRIFERFYRADPSRRPLSGGGGLGLGLAIARQLAEAQGGTLRAESSRGQGAAFILVLPAAHD